MVCSCIARAGPCFFSVQQRHSFVGRTLGAAESNYYWLVYVHMCMYGAGSWTAVVAGLQVLLVLIVDVMLGTAIQGPHLKHTQCQQQYRGYNSTAGLSITLYITY